MESIIREHSHEEEHLHEHVHSHAHGEHHHGPSHSHEEEHHHGHGHSHEEEHHDHHDHPHGEHHHGHGHGHEIPNKVTLGSLLTLGISGGIVPCTGALVILLLAVALHRIAFGLLLLVAFSVGLAAILIAIGVLIVKARPLVERFSGDGRWIQRLPIASAVVIIAVGCAITLGIKTLMGLSGIHPSSIGLEATIEELALNVAASKSSASATRYRATTIIREALSNHDRTLLREPVFWTTAQTSRSGHY